MLVEGAFDGDFLVVFSAVCIGGAALLLHLS